MGVETWDPRPAGVKLSDTVLAELLAAAPESDGAAPALDAAQADRLAACARHHDDGSGPDWATAARPLADDQLMALIRLFTLGEAQFDSWTAGDASPVIPLAAELKRRGRFPDDLTAWIRANSRNRFLPYGNLMKRL